jgi:hypothetical protein
MAGSAFETVALALKSVIDTEFAPEGYTAILDNLHESLGRTRVDIGIAPVEDTLMTGNDVVQETYVEVKFYHLWTQEISPSTIVNPTQITAYAERFRDAVRRAKLSDPGTGQVWYFDVRRVQYPSDPTGNKTRFVARVRAFGNNAGLVETTS